MKSFIRWLFAVVFIAALAHAAAILAAPNVIMNVVLSRTSADGTAPNTWRFQPQVTPQTQQIVRSSPDLAYASCAFDLSQGPVRLKFVPGPGYASLSLYAANTDNFFVINDREAPPEGIELAVIHKGARPPEGAVRVVESPTTRGLVLDRRVAPTPEDFAIADRIRRANICAAWSQ
jgi:uncharacterized membrane protein